MINYNDMVPPMPQLPQSRGGSYSNNRNTGEWKKQQVQRSKQQHGQEHGHGQQDNMMSLSKVKCRLNKYTRRYELVIPSLGYRVCELDLPKGNQYVLDVACMENIATILSQRYNITKNKIKTTSSHSAFKGQNVYSNIFYIQVDISKYEFYLPNGKYIGWVLTPPDGIYGQDLTVIKEVCKALACRFCLI